MNNIHITLIHDCNIESELFSSFASEIKNDNLRVLVKGDTHPLQDGMACYEWLIPPLVLAYIAKSYFDGFLKEAGKDHYTALKNMISKVGEDVLVKQRIEPRLYATEGKLNPDNPYSIAFSIISEAHDGKKFRLLVPKYFDGVNYSEIVNEFMDFTYQHHFDTDDYEISNGFILLHYNFPTKKIESVSFAKGT